MYVEPNDFALPENLVKEFENKKIEKPPRPRNNEPFIAGKLPLDWIQRASKLPGRALQAGMAIWYLAGLNNSRTVKLSSKVLNGFIEKRTTGYNAITTLEKADLISVQRHQGRNPIVTIKRIKE